MGAVRRTTRNIARPDGRALTEQQALFVHHYVDSGGDWRSALKKAGYGSEYWDLKEQPKIASAIKDEVSRRLNGEASILAIGVLLNILKDQSLTETPQGQRIRLDAAKTVLDRSGHIAPKAESAQVEVRDVASMTLPEIEDFIARGQAALTAMTVNPAPLPLIEQG